MQNSKVFFRMLLTIFMLTFSSSFFTADASVPQPSDSFYINDFANVIYPENEEYILSNSKTLADKTGAQLVVATVESLEGRDVDSYALDMFREWKIGGSKDNNGVLILLAPNERKVRIEVGYGLEGRINDSKAGRFIDEYAVPRFKNDNWDEGILSLYLAVLSEIYSEYGVEIPENVSDKVMAYNEDRNDTHMSTIISIIIVSIVVLFGGILPFVLRRKRRFGRKFHDWDDWDDWDNWNSGGGNSGGFGGFGGFGGDSGGSFGGFGGSSGGGGASRSF